MKPGCQPWALALGGREDPASSGLRSMEHGVLQRKRRCLFRRAPPLSAWHPLLGAGASCGQTLVGGLDSLSGRGFGHMPLGLGPAQLWRASRAEQAEGYLLPALGLSAPPWKSGWHFCCSHSSDTRPCVGHGRREQSRSIFWVAVHLRGGPVYRRASAGPDAGCQRHHWGKQATAGVLTPPALWLGLLSLCQPVTPIP